MFSIYAKDILSGNKRKKCRICGKKILNPDKNGFFPFSWRIKDDSFWYDEEILLSENDDCSDDYEAEEFYLSEDVCCSRECCRYLYEETLFEELKVMYYGMFTRLLENYYERGEAVRSEENN